MQAHLPGADLDPILNAALAGASPPECQWRLREPPDGIELDPALVNLRIGHGASPAEPLYYVASEAGCTAAVPGWYFDDPRSPTRVIVCPATCSALQADASARLEIAFGCARETAPGPGP
jgi:hypothetical protein